MEALPNGLRRACRSARRLPLALLAAIAIAAALALAAARPAAADSDAGGLFDPLVSDVTSYVPTTYQDSFLLRIDAAIHAWTLDILPPSPILPPNPIEPGACAASMLLTSLVAQADGLQAAGLLSQNGAGAIKADISTLQSALFTPTDPCLPPSPI